MSERVPDPPSPYAGYVSYSDYARLAARVAELEAENAKLHAEFLPLDRAEMRRLITRCDEIVRAASPLTRPDEDWHGAALRILSDAARAEVDNG